MCLLDICANVSTLLVATTRLAPCDFSRRRIFAAPAELVFRK